MEETYRNISTSDNVLNDERKLKNMTCCRLAWNKVSKACSATWLAFLANVLSVAMTVMMIVLATVLTYRSEGCRSIPFDPWRGAWNTTDLDDRRLEIQLDRTWKNLCWCFYDRRLEIHLDRTWKNLCWCFYDRRLEIQLDRTWKNLCWCFYDRRLEIQLDWTWKKLCRCFYDRRLDYDSSCEVLASRPSSRPGHETSTITFFHIHYIHVALHPLITSGTV